MAFSGSPFFQIPRPIRRKGFLNVETIVAQKTLVSKDSEIQVLSAAVGRDVNLPALLDGLYYKVLASGVGTLTVKNAAGSTVVSLTTGNAAELYCDGVAWVAI